MKFTTLPKPSMSQQSLRIINLRGLLLKGLAVAGGVAALAFGGGLWMGMNLNDRAEPDVTTPTAQNSTREKLVIAKLGELSARLQQLQSNADSLTKSVGAQEEITRKLKAIDPRFTPNGLPPAPKTHVAKGGGGPLLPPLTCDNKVLGSRNSDASALPLADIEQTGNALDCLRTLLDQVQAVVAARDADLMAVPSTRPVDTGKIGSPFGNRIDPFTHRLALHSGLDFPASTGTPVYSAAGGKVVFTGPYAGYGSMVTLDHGNGFVTRYAHTSKIYVNEGDVVMPHQLIAAIGSTGRSTGPHLHFEVLYRTQFIDPKNFLALGNMEVATDDQALD
jgi:murein DD-endopeptidase MepM/ murein hydrolase activator NlpD